MKLRPPVNNDMTNSERHFEIWVFSDISIYSVIDVFDRTAQP